MIRPSCLDREWQLQGYKVNECQQVLARTLKGWAARHHGPIWLTHKCFQEHVRQPNDVSVWFDIHRFRGSGNREAISSLQCAWLGEETPAAERKIIHWGDPSLLLETYKIHALVWQPCNDACISLCTLKTESQNQTNSHPMDRSMPYPTIPFRVK